MRSVGRGVRVLALSVPCVAIGLAALGACDGDPLYGYLGRKYDPARGCLGPDTVLDVIVGTRKSDCAPVCLVGAVGDGATELYVSTDCEPYPRGYLLSDSERYCAEAKASLTRGDRCLSDGGQTNPPVDAGPDADASAQMDSGTMDAASDGPVGADASDAGLDASDAGADGAQDAGAD